MAAKQGQQSLSTMRRIKTYLRSSMSQDRLNHVMLLNIYKSRLDDLDLGDVTSTFIAVNDGR